MKKGSKGFFIVHQNTLSKVTKQSSHFSPDTSDNTMRSLYLIFLLSIWIIVTVACLVQEKNAEKKSLGGLACFNGIKLWETRPVFSSLVT